MDTKLIVSASPHLRSEESTTSLMANVIVALTPCVVASAIIFGWRALLVTAVSVIACVGFEWLYCKLLKKPNPIGDLSAVVTGIILAMNVPVGMPLGQLIVGDLVAIVVVKQLFGGIGKNFVNPALAGRAALVASYAGTMSGAWADPQAGWVPLAGTADVVTAATPLAYMKTGDMAGLTSQYSVTDMFLGNIGGSLGEISALLLIVGGAYLIWRKVISWQTPAAYIAPVAVLTFLFPKGGADNLQFMLYSIFGGGLMLGAFFMATDYTTSPVTKTGQLIFGLGCGLLTVFIRYFGSYPEGVCYSIMIMNLVVALIDKAVKPSRFGVVKSANKEAAAK